MITAITVLLALVLASGGAYWLGRQATDLKLNGMRRLTLPIDAEAGTEATLLLPWELTTEDYGQFLDVLFAMQRGLVSGPTPEPPERLPDREPPTRLDAQRQHEAEVLATAQNEPVQRAHWPKGLRR